MQRTQIYLKKTQVDYLTKEAQKTRSTVSEIIRTIIDTRVRPQKKAKGKKPLTLLQIAAKVNKGGPKAPADLATNLDHYLYG